MIIASRRGLLHAYEPSDGTFSGTSTQVTATRDTYDGQTLGLLQLLLLLDLVLRDHVHPVPLLHHAAVVLTHGTYTLQPATRQLYRVLVCSYPTYVIGTFS